MKKCTNCLYNCNNSIRCRLNKLKNAKTKNATESREVMIISYRRVA